MFNHSYLFFQNWNEKISKPFNKWNSPIRLTFFILWIHFFRGTVIACTFAFLSFCQSSREIATLKLFFDVIFIGSRKYVRYRWLRSQFIFKMNIWKMEKPKNRALLQWRQRNVSTNITIIIIWRMPIKYKPNQKYLHQCTVTFKIGVILRLRWWRSHCLRHHHLFSCFLLCLLWLRWRENFFQ